MPLGDSRGLTDDSAVIIAGGGGRAHAAAGHVLTRMPFAGYWEYFLDDAIMTEPAHPHWSGAGLIGEKGQLVGVGSLSLQRRTSAGVSGLNMFVGTWNSDAQAAPIDAAVKSFFLGGGDLFLLQDDSGHDGLGASLGISTTASTGTVSNGGAPLFNGPFGTAHDVKQFYLTGQLDSSAISAHGGHVGGTNVEGQITSAFWKAGEYAPGAGSLFIVADIDMIATTTACGLPLCGASYSPLNDNGVYALNTFSFLETTGGTPPLPEPGTFGLMLAGLGALGVINRRRRQSTKPLQPA